MSPKLGLLTIAHTVFNNVNATESVADLYISKHPELFEGVGKLKGYQVKLHIDQSVPPVAQPHRRIPFHTRQKLEEELD